jgi:hypothetical protein
MPCLDPQQGPMKDSTGKGGIYVLTYADDPKNPVSVERITVDNWPYDLDFHPLGLDIIPGPPGKPSTLFVVNHARVATAVEKIRIDPATLRAGKQPVSTPTPIQSHPISNHTPPSLHEAPLSPHALGRKQCRCAEPDVHPRVQ